MWISEPRLDSRLAGGVFIINSRRSHMWDRCFGRTPSVILLRHYGSSYTIHQSILSVFLPTVLLNQQLLHTLFISTRGCYVVTPPSLLQPCLIHRPLKFVVRSQKCVNLSYVTLRCVRVYRNIVIITSAFLSPRPHLTLLQIIAWTWRGRAGEMFVFCFNLFLSSPPPPSSH